MATSARSRPRLALAAGGSGGDGGGGRHLILDARLRQAIRILELSRRELIEEIRKECEANPLLMIDDEE
jgi:hypothetical protein